MYHLKNDISRRLIPVTIALGVIGLTAACAHVGSDISEEYVSHIKSGATTRQEIHAALGEPTSVYQGSDGQQLYLWSAARSRLAGAGVRMHNLIIEFDQYNRVKHFDYDRVE